MDDVMIVDDVAVLATPLRWPATAQGQKLRGAEEAFESIVVETNIEPAAHRTRWNSIEHAPRHEAAARRDLDPRLLVISRAPFGKWLEQRALDLDALAVASIAPADHLIHEAAIGGKVSEFTRAAQQQFIAKHILDGRCDRGCRRPPTG